jgi:hypothetical protein
MKVRDAMHKGVDRVGPDGGGGFLPECAGSENKE